MVPRTGRLFIAGQTDHGGQGGRECGDQAKRSEIFPIRGLVNDPRSMTSKQGSGFTHARECADDLLDLTRRMLGAERATQKRHVRRRRWRSRKIHVEPFTQQGFPHTNAGLEIGHNNRNDGALRFLGAELESSGSQPLMQRLRVLPEA